MSEWDERRARGRPSLPANHPDAIRSVEQFHSHDRNEVHDDTASEIMWEVQAETDRTMMNGALHGVSMMEFPSVRRMYEKAGLTSNASRSTPQPPPDTAR